MPSICKAISEGYNKIIIPGFVISCILMAKISIYTTFTRKKSAVGQMSGCCLFDQFFIYIYIYITQSVWRVCMHACVCVCVCMCACRHACVVYFGVSVQCSQAGKGAGWLLVSRATLVVKIAVDLTSYNDCLYYLYMTY